MRKALIRSREPQPAAEEQQDSGGMYFTSPKENHQFVKTGATLLDCVLGGGYPLGRFVNIVGDKSTGKTLLAMEALANFSRQYPEGRRRYNEVESAWDAEYAAALGIHIQEDELFEGCNTVEEFYTDFEEFLALDDRPKIYILDSLDSLSSNAETDSKITDASYGDGKAKFMSKFFRLMRRKCEESNCLLIIISQIRDNIGAGMFAKKHTRSGGKALDFYASIVLWLAYLKAVKKTASKVERQIGVEIKAKTEKNKIGLPFRDCTFQITFGYGIEDHQASMDWLKSIGIMPGATAGMTPQEVSNFVIKQWYKIESNFIQTRSKYGGDE